MMTDVIDRKAAIDAMTNTLWHYPNECYRNLNEYEFAKGLAELGLKSVPSAQPDLPIKEKCAFCPHCNNCDANDDLSIQPCMDTISRQAAIDAVRRSETLDRAFGYGHAVDALRELPSAQPEVIHCGECRYYKDVTSIHGDCECGEMWQSLFGEITEVEAINVHKDHYCGYAEKKNESNK